MHLRPTVHKYCKQKYERTSKEIIFVIHIWHNWISFWTLAFYIFKNIYVYQSTCTVQIHIIFMFFVSYFAYLLIFAFIPRKTCTHISLKSIFKVCKVFFTPERHIYRIFFLFLILFVLDFFASCFESLQSMTVDFVIAKS